LADSLSLSLRLRREVVAAFSARTVVAGLSIDWLTPCQERDNPQIGMYKSPPV
jgi:hypothetical protein